MGFVTALKCRECGKEFEKLAIHVCEFCFGPLETAYDYDGIGKVLTRELIESRKPNMWRYKELLPLDEEPQFGLNVGYTPLHHAKNLGEEWGMEKLYIKNDSVNHPSFSFKDRVVATAISKAAELGFTVVGCASTGNLANSVAAIAAQAKMEAHIFIPADLEAGKVVATQVSNPTLIKINGSYDDVNRLCSEIGDKYKIAFVNINIRAYYGEGSKTYGYEIAEQLGWRAPDQVVVPIAGSSLITKIDKSFKELEKLGLIGPVSTKIFGAQATGCSPVTTAVKNGWENFKPQKPNTIARSIAIGNPADGYYGIKVINQSGGWAEDVTDEELVEGMKLLGRHEGIFTETAGGVVVATAKKLLDQGKLDPTKETVLCVTGNGLKTQEALLGHFEPAPIIDPNLNDYEKIRNK